MTRSGWDGYGRSLPRFIFFAVNLLVFICLFLAFIFCRISIVIKLAETPELCQVL